MPSYKLQKIRILYLELPYNIFSPLFSDFNQKKSSYKLIINELKKGVNKLYQDKIFLKSFATLLLAARDHGIAVQACDINSLNFINHSERLIDKKQRLNVKNACMIRTIEALQFKYHHPKFLLLVGLAPMQSLVHELAVPSCYSGNGQILKKFSALSPDIDYSVMPNGALQVSNSKFFMKFNTQLEIIQWIPKSMK